MEYVIGVDIGGTCTDCVVLDPAGALTIGKAFSTPPNFAAGVLDAVRVAAEALSLQLDELLARTRLFLHATTMADNAVVEGNLARGGMLVTRGFESTLTFMRGGYAEWSGRTEEEIKNIIYAKKPSPLVPSGLIKGIKERMDSRGEVFAKIDPSDVRQAARELVDKKVDALGIAFLWSFINPAHEDLAEAIVKEEFPDLFCTKSHEIAPVLGEFERTQTVALNIGLGPAVSKYLVNLEQQLQDHRYRGPVLIMQAYGGLLGTQEAARRPVGMIESGPVSGLVGCQAMGKIMGFRDIIGADMGGTTFKAGVIGGGMIDYAREPMVLQYHYASPKMNMESIGLAGGSIISLDPVSRTPRIGPKSAGSYPGPVCYDNGGNEPTISDVDLLLGYLDERYFLGGRRGLNRARAKERFEATIAKPLDMGVTEAAAEVYRLANSMIYDMLHKLTVEQGVDPRTYVLFSYGGTLGMHVTAFAPQLGVRAVVIPYSASVHGACGLVTSDIAYEAQITRPLRMPVPVEVLNGIFKELSDKVVGKLRTDGFDQTAISTRRSIDMRYRRQVHVVTTPVNTDGPLQEHDIELLQDQFDALYEDRFGKGSGFREAGVEMVNFRLRGIGALGKPEMTSQSLSGADPRAAFVETRVAHFGTVRANIEANCYDFERLRPGNKISGPAIIWSPITTIVINPDQRADVDAFKNLTVTW